MSAKKLSYKQLQERCAKAEKALDKMQARRAKGILLADMAKAHKREAHIKQVLLAIRNVNQLIVQETDPVRLVERACVTLTETMGYYSAWIARTDENGKPFHLAEAGHKKTEFGKLQNRIRRGYCPHCIERAQKNRRIVVLKTPTAFCRRCPLGKAHSDHAHLAIRLEIEGRIYGALSVSLPRSYAADAEEQNLFREVAGDIAFALHKMEREEQRRDLERERQHLLDSMMNAFLILRGVYNRRGRLVNCRVEYANEAFGRMYGTKFSRIKDKTVTELWPAIGKDWIDDYRAVAKTGKSRSFVRASSNNEKIYHCILYCPWETRDRFCVIIEDVTEDKRKTDALLKSEASLKQAQSLARIGNWSLDIKTNRFEWSDSIFDIFEFDKNNYVPEYASVMARVHPDDLGLVEKVYSTSVKNKTAYTLDHRLLLNDSRVKWVNEICRTEYDKKGRPVRSIGTVQDITDIKIAQEALRENEAKLSALFDSMTEMLVLHEMVFDKRGRPCNYRITACNQAFTKQTGISAEAALGNLATKVYGTRPAPYIREYAQVVKSGKPLMLETYFEPLKKHFAISVVSLGQHRFATISTNITERKNNEDALRFQARVLNEIHDLITITDPQGFITYVNDAECRMLNMKREDLIGQHVSIYGNDPCSSATQDEIVRMSETDGNWRGDVINHRPDGSRLVLDCRIFAMRDEQGRTTSLCGISTDITERKKFEDALKASEEKYRTIFENAPLGMFRTTLRGRFIEVNPAMAKLYGYDSQNEMAESVTNIATQLYADPDERRALIENIKDLAGMIQHQIQGKRKDGSVFSANIYVKAVRDDKGRIRHLEGIIEDITQRRQAEEEKNKLQARLFHAQKMESLGGLAAGMAHEINNPLGIILQTAQNIGRRIDPQFPKNLEISRNMGLDLELMHAYLSQRDIYTSIETVRNAAQRAASIVRHMLNFSRKNDPELMHRDINAILDNTLDMVQKDYDLRKNYNFKDISIKKKYSALPAVLCMETEISQVFLNIVKNAAQALALGTSDGRKPTVTLRTTARDGYVRVEIGDNGPGMDETTAKRAFEPFFTSKAPGRGTGLGLSVSYFIITTHHGGNLRLKSTPGHGATFIIELPAADGK